MSKGHGWIQTFTGRKIYPLNPDPESFCVEDIAHALANLCRFTGHTKEFYSVAQHSCLVHDNVPPEYRLEALFHDAAEAYLADIATPVKHSGALGAYVSAEEELRWAILRWLRPGAEAPHGLSPAVAEADVRMLMTEKRDLLAPMVDGTDWSRKNAEPYGFSIQSWSPTHAKWQFLARAAKLLPGRHIPEYPFTFYLRATA